MAIVVDPDNLDRFQVIFGTTSQLVSIYPVGADITAQRVDGATTSATVNFTGAAATFQSDGVAPGDILCILTGADAGHYTVATVSSETALTVETTASFTTFSATDTGLTFTIQEPTGGSTTDGVTLQALYSFGKEEWRVDSQTFGSDDLIRHEFPFEAITSEQFEIGGGDAHWNWNWFNEFTRKKVRTGGWAERNSVGTTLFEWTGIVTLGFLDADTQVYYQQTSATTTPVNFDFLGAVNESIQTFEDGGADNRTYLKLFARKKGRTYAQSEIADIGVSTIQTIVNRFPLSHAVDAAIVATDGQILGTSPFRNQGTALESGTDGSVTVSQDTFTSSGSTFTTNGVAAGDTLQITSGTQQGYYTILAVNSETELQIAPDFEFTTWGSTEATLSFSVTSTVILTGSTDGALADVDGATGTLTSATGGFTGTVAAGDLVIITEASAAAGVYEVISQDSDTQLTLDTTDYVFGGETAIDFEVREPGMYLQYKEDTITLAGTGNLTFANANPDTIQRASGSWATDGVSAGSVITISGSTNNDGSYTVASLTTTSTADDTVVLVATDSLTAEGPVAATATAYDAFKRDIGGVTYAYHWKLTGNNATLANCYQFIQHQLRQTTDIDNGNGVFRGDVTDLLMSFSTPTGTMLDLFIDNLATTDINNATFQDATGINRNFPFLASVTLNFNTNLQNDANAKYWLFFTNDDAGDNSGFDFSTENAILVQNSNNVDVTGNVGGSPSISFTYDYDGNVQRGAASAGEDAPVTLVALGLDTAQYVIVTGTITRSTANSISAVAALERNYSNP